MNLLVPRDQLRVSVVAGVIVRHDAISNVCRQQVAALEAHARRAGVRLDLRVFTGGSDVPDSRTVFTSSAADLARDAHFQASDLVLFHFGIYYPAFEAVHLAPRTARVVVDFHGITPPGLHARDADETLGKSYRQLANLAAADGVIVHSRFIRRDLDDLGLSAVVPVEVIPLSVALPPPPARPAHGDGHTCRIAYVGRFVPAKGVIDLVRAAARVRDRGHRVRLDLMGSRRFSCERYIGELEDAVRATGLDVRFGFDRPGSEIAEALAAADLFVLPSFHEGFCVPVLEALTCGACVVCSDAGALPETAGGLGLIYPAGDVEALAERIERFLRAREGGVIPTDAGDLTSADWQRAREGHLAEFVPERVDARFCEFALSGLRAPLPGCDERNAVARMALLDALRQPGEPLRPRPPAGLMPLLASDYPAFWPARAANPAAEAAPHGR